MAAQPALPPAPKAIQFPVTGGIAKGRKFRTTWISYDALAGLHDHLQIGAEHLTDKQAARLDAKLTLGDPEPAANIIVGRLARTNWTDPLAVRAWSSS